MNISLNTTAPCQSETQKIAKLYQSGKLEHAKIEAEALTLRFPKHFFGWKVLGLINIKSGQLKKGLSALQKAVSLEPGDFGLHNNLGHILQKTGKPRQALDHYRLSLGIKPEQPVVCNLMGNAHRELGEHGKALSCFQKALDINPDFFEAYNNMGNTFKARRYYQNFQGPCRRMGGLQKYERRRNELRDRLILDISPAFR